MKKLSNGKNITQESILEMIEECARANWKSSDLHTESEKIFEKMTLGYDGIEEDFEYIIPQLDNYSNLQDIESVIKDGEWHFGTWNEYK